VAGAEPIALVWFRRDLRLDDHPALGAAAARGRVLPVFLWSPAEDGAWAPGAASRLWLHHSLCALREALAQRGLGLLVRRSTAAAPALLALAKETGAEAVHWNRLYEPASVARDAEVKRALREAGVEAHSHNGALLNEPHTVATRQGSPFRVFTPFYKHCAALGPPREPRPVPRGLKGPRPAPRSETVDSLGLLPAVDWAGGIRAAWSPGEAGARRELESFADATVAHYGEGRDQPALAGTSRLSPHLHFGEISPQRVWHTLATGWPGRGRHSVSVQVEPFTRQLYWREFAHHLLFHFPHTTSEPLAAKFERFPWADEPALREAWQHGRTGYPLVDAGMRELWHTGWMHNRVRMNVASFLVKHLLSHWLHGARWFWDTLVDADLANNTLGWQWAAGCGADAAPYFRIFNPVRQGERFDPRGDYVRRWVPELAALPAEHLHAPWEAPAQVLAGAGVTLGTHYPRPVVDHKEARRRALAALDRTRG
jgi:deoxyribodipyrimidine photo-lyase